MRRKWWALRGVLMKTSFARTGVFSCTLLAILFLPGKTKAQTRTQEFRQQQTNNSVLQGPGIEKLVNEKLSRRDLSKLVTNPSTIREHPDLAQYYKTKAQRQFAESKRYERFARAAGDTKPLSEPNHYGVSRSARFNYLAAKYELKRAQHDDLLAALNAQAREKEGCFSCHSLHGQGGKIGPDLALEGARGRSDAWLTAHFKDPQAVSANSVMPRFEGLIDHQLEVLSAFLQYQK